MAPNTNDSMSALPPIPSNIAEITAPLLFGYLWNWTLYGVLVVQVYIYYLCFPNDKKVFKILIYAVFAIDTVQTALSGVDLWYWFCHGFGDMTRLTNTFLSPYDTPILGSLIALIRQLFFCYRIWVLNKNYLLPGFIATVAIFQAIGGLIQGYQSALVPNFNSFRGHIDIIGIDVWLIGTAVTDTLIAICLSYLLITSTGGSSTRSNNIVQSITHNLDTPDAASIAIISIVLFFSLPDKSYFICPTAILGKLYSNALLMTFNNRIILARHLENSTSGSNSGVVNSFPRASQGFPSAPRSQILIAEETTTRYDEPIQLGSFGLSMRKEAEAQATLPRFPDSTSTKTSIVFQ
ncbi:hypothetical protein M422DRAFT_263474 [Sphaerobolus stellatus SS14]|uniref:DUF6534 domain-containing protein n=1 Tax=Sphaerobolus stellatus (strain SS14) TaxID=990650 RepID=A0A0C9VAJ6_SPHS4|nr:hypothetical protein M422DRAFT_263474 [Sphaerobolus stellatus SS14]